MPITLVPPVDNLFVGPGSTVTVSTNFIGPFPTGTFWEMEIRRTGDEQVLSAGRNDQFTHTATLYPNIFIQSTGIRVPQWYPQPPAAAQPAQSAMLVIRLRETPSTVLEQTSSPIQWRPEPAGVAWVQSLQSQTAAAGFQPSDRSTLQDVLSAVRVVLPAALAGGPNLIVQVIDLLRGPPMTGLRTFGSQLIFGRGTLSAQPPGALHSFGGTWQVAVVPPGTGYDDGVVREYHRRIAQFEVIRIGAGDHLYIDVLEDSHRGNDFIRWQFPNPIQINYDVAPGFTLLWEWLV